MRLITKYTRIGDDEPIRTQLDNLTGVEVTIDTEADFKLTVYLDVDGQYHIQDNNGVVVANHWKRRDDERQATLGEPCCPKCGGRMWDNRLSKRNPKAPDFKCRSRSCDGAIWPEREFR